MKKKIGIVGWNTGENSFGTTRPYLNLLSHFGEVVILTPMEGIVEGLDLLVLPGGADVDTNRYKSIPGYYNTAPNQFLEYFDQTNLPKYIAAKTPIFGICRGLQTLGVFFGCTLNQNIPHPYSSESRDELVHSVIDVVKREQFKTNSLHHQNIKYLNEKELFASLVTVEKKQGVKPEIEGIRHKELKISAVQHHPEEIFDSYSINEIKTLLNL